MYMFVAGTITRTVTGLKWCSHYKGLHVGCGVVARSMLRPSMYKLCITVFKHVHCTAYV